MTTTRTKRHPLATTVLAGALAIGPTLPASAAVTQVEGAAGGGIVPWALLSSGKPTGSFTWVDSGEYTLSSLAVQARLADRLELSLAHMDFDTGVLDHGHFTVDVLGAKLKITDMNGGMPAIAVGVQHKRSDDNGEGVYDALGAEDSGTDVYVSAAKVVPVGDKNLLLNGTLRATKANQVGILGFGSATDDDYSLQFEGSAGVFLTKNTVLGAEYRTKPDNIDGIKEEDWADAFIAYFPNKNLSVVAAYADLGDIVAEVNPNGKDQRGFYLQIQGNF